MMTKCVFFFVAAFLFATTSAGVLPLASYAVAPIASSYSAHTVHHAVASPVVAAAAPLVAAPAPFVHAASPYVAAPAPLAYSAYPFGASYIG